MSLFNRFISATTGILGLFLTGAALAIVRCLSLFTFAALFGEEQESSLAR